MITADTIHSTFTPGQITAGRSVPVCIDTDLAVATRVFLDAARRSMSPQTQADYRSQAYAMLARILIASVSRENAE